MCNFTQEVSTQFTANIHVQFHTTPYLDITSTYFQRPIILRFRLLHIRPSEWVPPMQSLNQNLICLSFPATIHVICTTYLNWQADTLINVAFKMLKLYKIFHEIFFIFKLLNNCKGFLSTKWVGRPLEVDKAHLKSLTGFHVRETRKQTHVSLLGLCYLQMLGFIHYSLIWTNTAIFCDVCMKKLKLLTFVLNSPHLGTITCDNSILKYKILVTTGIV